LQWLAETPGREVKREDVRGEKDHDRRVVTPAERFGLEDLCEVGTPDRAPSLRRPESCPASKTGQNLLTLSLGAGDGP
jgi:hypothetical protein